MIEQRNGNLLTEPLDAFVHQANIYHTFGAGIAFQIKEQFPAAYEADRCTLYADEGKLGTVSSAVVEREFGEQIIFNMYSQIGWGVTSYGHMLKALNIIKEQLLEEHRTTVGFPHGMGCGIANGDWVQVERLIADVFEDSPITAVIVKYVR